MGVVIEVDTGMHRAGVVSPDAALELARGLASLRASGWTG